MLKIKYYNTNVGVIFQVHNAAYYSGDILKNSCDFIDNTPVESIQSLNKGWFKIDSLPCSIKKKVKAKKVMVGHELKSPSLVSDKVPAFLTLEQLPYVEDDNEDYYGFSGEYKEIAYLYVPKYEEQPEKLEEVSFELVHLGDIEVSNYTAPEKMLIKQVSENFGGKVQTADLSDIVRYEDLYELLTPSFLVHNCPCYLSSEQMFKIVRHYVKENINPRVAEITSDYAFCFTVKKVLMKEPSVVSKLKKPQRELFEVFEMTWKGYGGKKNGYEGYTPIAELKADSLEDMKNKLEDYLKNLIEKINAEVKQCSCCNGTGHVVNKIETNFKL